MGRLRLRARRAWLRACLEQLHARLQAARGPRGAGAAPRQAAGGGRAQPQQPQPAADAAELAAALSLMAHFAPAAERAWVGGALAAVAGARAALSDEALLHALVSCAALGLAAPLPPPQQQPRQPRQQQPGAGAPAAAPRAPQQAAAQEQAHAGQLLALARARVATHAARRDAVALSRAARLLGSHAQRGFPAWYGELRGEAGAALAACAGGAGDAPARRLA